MPRILLAVDGSEHDASSMEVLGRLFGEKGDVHVTVLTVAHMRLPEAPSLRSGIVPSIPPLREMEVWEAEIRQDSADIVSAASEELLPYGFEVETRVEWGRPAEVVLEVADDGDYDLIAMGRYGAGKVVDLFVGSVSGRVLQRAKIPVLVVRSKGK